MRPLYFSFWTRYWVVALQIKAEWIDMVVRKMEVESRFQGLYKKTAMELRQEIKKIVEDERLQVEDLRLIYVAANSRRPKK
jgi:hypothetical protein